MSIKIALAGNPNSGKTTLFNALTGSNQYVGNWPGVTVEKKEGKLKKHDDVTITDLPGIYSLSPYTLEEVVARNYLLNESPDAILNIVDGTNLERNLYLTTQLVELGIPTVLALNMADLVAKSGDKININELSRALGVKIISISALKGDGVMEAAEAAIEAAKNGKTIPQHTFSGPVEHALAHIEEAILHDMPQEKQRWYAIKVFERDEKVLAELKINESTLKHIEQDIQAAEAELDDDAESIITNERYVYIAEILRGSYKKASAGKMTTSDKIDRIVTNRWLGLPIFALVMFLVYYLAMIGPGTAATDWVNDVLFGEIVPDALNGWFESVGAAGWLQGLVVDGIVAGVGAVLGFLPQIIVLFICLALLESCGYMARVAFVMDRIFRKFGLSGKSFIPMLIGTGCGVPGVMASRTIEAEKDRRMTIMTTTFIPCGAKLPIIAMIAGAFFNDSALVAVSSYFIGMAAVILSGIALKKTKRFAGDPAPFVMELPAYHWPTFTNVFHSVWERVFSFVKKAGTIILISSIVVWFAQTYGIVDGQFGEVDQDQSFLAAFGNLFAWIFKPLGFGNWQATAATLTGLIAKENLVNTFGILFAGLEEVSESGEEIWSHLAATYTPLAAYSMLVFNLLCAPCFAAMGAIRREMNNGKWFAFAIAYQCILAYCVSLVIYQVGSALTGNLNVLGLIVAILLIVFALYMLFRPAKYDEKGNLLKK